MENVDLFISQVSSGKAPVNWSMEKPNEMQRLYYIKGGKGSIVLNDGTRIPFVPGKIYVFAYCFKQNFITDPYDPIDHIYFDFFSTPPIIYNEPIIYDVPENSHLSHLLRIVDSVLPKMIDDGDWVPYSQARDIGKIVSPSPGSDEEMFSILYKLLDLLLALLSKERPLPFTNDKIILPALEKIHRDYARDISVSELAGDVGFEVNHFIRRFKRIMGVTPYVYLCNYRCSMADSLINSGATVTEAAEKVGYSSTSTLSRALRSRKKNKG